eukprot:TRINITY_DN121280_c0_g1_i1.p2 TRINITY_DN121280_c0_g1~~TRINITY_DN121280_c0_g1_i1.p2  ORF type:complete len:304 (+),score=18.89 TRINITY_DN121280_c0_g1_i1:1959-2870(+)
MWSSNKSQQNYQLNARNSRKVKLRVIAGKNSHFQAKDLTPSERILNNANPTLARNVKTLYNLLSGFPLLRKEGREKIKKIKEYENMPLESLSRFQLLRTYITLLGEYKKAIQQLKAPVDVTCFHAKDLLDSNEKEISGFPKLHPKRISKPLRRKYKKNYSNVNVIEVIPHTRRNAAILNNAKAESYSLLENNKRFKGLIVQNSPTRNKSTLSYGTESKEKKSSFVTLLPDLGERQKRVRERYNAIFHTLKRRAARHQPNEVKENLERWNEGPKQNTYFDEFLDMSISKIGFHYKSNPVHLSFS